MLHLDQYSTRASLVILPRDDFNGAIIYGSNIHACIEGQPPPLKKKDGYLIFCNLKSGEYHVKLSGTFYDSQEICVALSSDEDYRFLTVRMAPNRLYPVPKGTTCAEGYAQAGSCIQIFCTDPAKAYKLLYEYDNSKTEISIYHPGESHLDGKQLFISENSNLAEGEMIKIHRAPDNQNASYLLEACLRKCYPKIGTVLFPVFCTFADQNGHFFIPLSTLYQGENTYFCRADNGQKIAEKQLKLAGGTVSQIDLRGNE